MLYYTRAELEKAQSQNILHTLQAMGYALKQEGQYYRGILHDSIVINSINGHCHWNSKDVHGQKPVELLKQILIHDYGYEEKLAYITAIKRLAGTEGQRLKDDVSFPQNNIIEKKKDKNIDKGNIILPTKNKDNNKVINYLCHVRGLDYGIIKELIAQNKIYETKDYHNVCFVSYDENNVPHHGFLRGTMESKKFRKDVEHSDKSYSFIINGDPTTHKVYCFESATDSISHMSLYKMNKLNYKDGHRISLHGTSFLGLERFLENNPQIKEVVACLDNDEAGIKRAKKLCILYKEKGYYPFLQLPKEKDYNEELLKDIEGLQNIEVEKDY